MTEIEPAHHGELAVHESDIGLYRQDTPCCELAVERDRQRCQAWLTLEQRVQPGPHGRMVVDERDPDHAASTSSIARSVSFALIWSSGTLKHSASSASVARARRALNARSGMRM